MLGSRGRPTLTATHVFDEGGTKDAALIYCSDLSFLGPKCAKQG